MTNETHDCKLREKGFCECTDINLGLNSEEEAQALDAIEHEDKLSDELPH